MRDPVELLHNRAGFLLRRANQIAVASFMDALGDLKLTTTQYGALLIIETKQPIDQVGLARLLRLDRSTTGLAVSNLEKSGLITREPDDADRRRRMLQLTAKGSEVLQVAHERGAVSRLEAMAVFTPEEHQQLIGLLQKFVGAWEGKMGHDWDVDA